jgi:ubiquitin C-terminal hydrolase
VQGPRFVGLDNVLNCCYVNAPLQCLLHLDRLSTYFANTWDSIAQSVPVRPEGANGIAAAFRALQVQTGLLDPPPSISPLPFLQTLSSLKAGGGYDAAELMQSLLRLLDTDLVHYNRAWALQVRANPDDGVEPLPQADSSMIADLFHAEVKILRHCTGCGLGAHTRQTFAVWRLPIKVNGSRPLPVIDLSDLLAAWVSGTDLVAIKCPNCEKKKPPHESPRFTKLPPVLIIEIDRVAGTSGRLETVVRFPESLDMTKCAALFEPDATITYHLKAVIRHYTGFGPGRLWAHFKAFIEIDGSCYCFDDSVVTESQWDSTEGAVALLVYERL